MGYYTRVLSKRTDCPSYDELASALKSKHPHVVLSVEDDREESAWENLVLSHEGGPEIAAIERNEVAPGSVGADEIAEFVEEVTDGQPASAVPWLTDYLGGVKTIYAFQHLHGSRTDDGLEALGTLRELIRSRGDAIRQADGEGFSNEEGDHILWQFSADVSGPWWMAVRQNDDWVSFEMDLGRDDHREAFLAGRVPPDVG
jgi:hypothetical protein